LDLFSGEVKSPKMTPGKYLDPRQYIWKNYVPKSFQVQTVVGELLRAMEKLSDEAQFFRIINFITNCQ